MTIDTGFDDDICIPISTAVALRLPLGGVGFIEMIDGSTSKQFIFEAECQMGDLPPRNVNVYITESEDGLIGAKMFRDMRVEIDYGHQTVRFAHRRLCLTVSLVPSQKETE
ncbi:hypothetical protein H8E77_39415 [bacterium]|nr:hypothetical protein [bacterium]